MTEKNNFFMTKRAESASGSSSLLAKGTDPRIQIRTKCHGSEKLVSLNLSLWSTWMEKQAALESKKINVRACRDENPYFFQKISLFFPKS
jgi:hypothetical protein